jgi:hypothetical protein
MCYGCDGSGKCNFCNGSGDCYTCDGKGLDAGCPDCGISRGRKSFFGRADADLPEPFEVSTRIFFLSGF